MAELLIKAIDATHADPDKDKRGCYKRGDIVLAMPDGHTWGREECLPTFYVVKVDMPLDEAKALAEPAYVLGNAEFGVAERRKHRFPINTRLDAATLNLIVRSDWFVPVINRADIEVK